VKIAALWSAGQVGRESGGVGGSCPWPICLQKGAETGAAGVVVVAAASQAGPGPAGAGAAGSAAAG
jgi:hypothetical protein